MANEIRTFDRMANIPSDYAGIVQMIMDNEGFVERPYYCSEGWLTIGFGRCLDKNPLTEDELKIVGDWKKGITREKAKILLLNDICKCLEFLRKNIDFYNQLESCRQYALVDMCYQLGGKGLLQFKKMLQAMEKQDWEMAVKECLKSKYGLQTPKRAQKNAYLILKGS